MARPAVLGQPSIQDRPVFARRGSKWVFVLPSGRHQMGSSQAQASARSSTLVTLPVAVWGSDGETRT